MTLTTVGYGDIVPETGAGRLAGTALMMTGVAVLDVLAGSLASFSGLDRPRDSSEDTTAAAAEVPPVHEELAALQAELHAIDPAQQ